MERREILNLLVTASRNLGSFLGLHLAWEQGYISVILEIDSLLVRNFLTSAESPGLEHGILLNRCRSFLEQDWAEEVRKIYREANFVAEGVANWVLHQELGYHLLLAPQYPFASSFLHTFLT